jgi:arylsulfatase
MQSDSETGWGWNTVVIWMSENGPEEIFPHNGTAGPWRGTYFTALEGSLRAPFLIRWPGKIKAGAVHNEIMHITDLYPTLARIAGAKIPSDRTLTDLTSSISSPEEPNTRRARVFLSTMEILSKPTNGEIGNFTS